MPIVSISGAARGKPGGHPAHGGVQSAEFPGLELKGWIIPQLRVNEITIGAGLATLGLLEALIVML
jgi:hypothetical protein